MKKTRIIFSVFCLLLLHSCGEKEKEETQVPEQPNILFILADDFGLRDMSFVGSEFYETPNIDRLASKGMVFTQGYSGSRVCSPARATIMTGQFTARHGITDWIGAKSGTDWREANRFDRLLPAGYRHRLPDSEITLAEALKTGGYKTFFAGKWHLGGEGSYPEDHGFEINKGGWEKGNPNGGYFSPFKNPKLEDIQPGENLSIRLAKETVAFMEDHKTSGFLAFLSFYAVHGPIQTTKEKWQKYREKARENGIAERGFTMEKNLPIRQTQDNPVYAGLVEAMDDAIGVVLDGLKESGLEKNTIVIFTSDNGGVASGDAYSTSNLPFRGGKGYQWEAGTRVPYLVYVPWQKSGGKHCDDPVTGADFYPTLLDYAGIDLPVEQPVDGVSLRPVIDRGEVLPERPLFWHYPHYGNQGGEPSSVIREGDWKLIHYYEDNRDELYHINDDPYEQENLAGRYPDKVSGLRNKLKSWLTGVGARYPTEDSEFDKEKKEAYHDRIVNKVLPGLEEQRMDFLSDSFEPNKDWWGSMITKD
ncbi:sulfatase [Sinomicrobium soli]|uniref:sulfatase n=1 Tax=Sinomicrobium sp. N-1-3-6 TaxID=2219864 RepID=UPI000DCF1CCA|nr:sulfatase [Sinomicrobium sp. N-1-3-6]RAV28095.1 sulfatase [Sinomicrobium sp. N-1-3-6]